jgi:hypothetical protein
VLGVEGMSALQSRPLEIRSVVGKTRFLQHGLERSATLSSVGIVENTLLVVHVDT